MFNKERGTNRGSEMAHETFKKQQDEAKKRDKETRENLVKQANTDALTELNSKVERLYTRIQDQHREKLQQSEDITRHRSQQHEQQHRENLQHNTDIFKGRTQQHDEMLKETRQQHKENIEFKQFKMLRDDVIRNIMLLDARASHQFLTELQNIHTIKDLEIILKSVDKYIIAHEEELQGTTKVEFELAINALLDRLDILKHSNTINSREIVDSVIDSAALAPQRPFGRTLKDKAEIGNQVVTYKNQLKKLSPNDDIVFKDGLKRFDISGKDFFNFVKEYFNI